MYILLSLFAYGLPQGRDSAMVQGRGQIPYLQLQLATPSTPDNQFTYSRLWPSPSQEIDP